MHVEPPRVSVSEIPANEGACLKQHTPANEHEDAMQSDQVEVGGSATFRRHPAHIAYIALQQPNVIRET